MPRTNGLLGEQHPRHPWRTASTAARQSGARLEVAAERAATIGVGLLIVTGFASSDTTLRDLAVNVGGFSSWLAPVVPLSFDVGIIVLSLKVVLAARAGGDVRVLRALVLVLSAATVVADGAASSTVVGRLLPAVPSEMLVVRFETLAASARHDAHARRLTDRGGAEEDVALLPVLTTARWLLAPRETWSIWRAASRGPCRPTSRRRPRTSPNGPWW